VAIPAQSVEAPQMEAVPEKPVQTEITYATVKPTNIYIQVGAFGNRANANKLQDRLTAIGQAQVSQTMVEARPFYRVRFGPLGSVDKADALLDSIIKAGYKDARVTLVE
jgi:rare lipoprotein A